MFMPATNRIKWFLSLQKILRFPRTFLAPTAVLRLARKRVAVDMETSAKRSVNNGLGKIVSNTVRQPRAPSLSHHQPVIASATRPGAPLLKRVLPGGSSVMLQHITKRPVVSTTPQLPNATPPPRTNRQPPSAIWRRIATLEPRRSPTTESLGGFLADRGLPGASPIATLEPRRSPKPAGLGGFLSDRELPGAGARPIATLEPRRSPKAAGLGGFLADRGLPGAISPGLRLLLSTGPLQPSLAPDLAATAERVDAPVALPNSTPEPNWDEPDTSKTGPVNASDETATTSTNRADVRGHSVSTLHLDGSVLGQWATQHLERALGRPASGMTGVDPRSTLPRSRVAPF